MNDYRNIKTWLNICCIAISLMIIVGGITRLTQSGLSMVEWKPITGILPPLNDDQWEEEFNKYKMYPEYKKINQFNFMTIDEYKRIYFWEYIHRVLGRIIGLLFILPFLFFKFKNKLNTNLSKKIVAAIFLVIIQGVLGWYMVKSGLVNNPHVSQFRLALHLLLAFYLLVFTYWIKLSLGNVKKTEINASNLFHINCILYIFMIQIVYGAFIAGTKAGKLWNTFPLIDGEFFPSQLISLKPIYSNFLNNMMMFQFVHRYVAVILLAYCGYYYFKTASNDRIGKYSGLLFMVVINQFILGIMTLLTGVQIELGILHQFFAIILILIIVRIKHSIVYSDSII